MATQLEVHKRPKDQSSDEEDVIMDEEKDSGDMASRSKMFVPSNMSDGVRNARYAVRGAIVQRAYQIKADLASNKGKVTYPRVSSFMYRGCAT